MSADPLVGGRPTDPELLGDMRCRPAGLDPSDKELPAEDRQTSSRMCHESLLLGWALNTSTVQRGSRLSITSLGTTPRPSVLFARRKIGGADSGGWQPSPVAHGS